MSVYHYHPDGIVYIRDPAGEYADTAENFALDYGSPAVLPVGGYNEIYFDDSDANQQAHVLNDTTPRHTPMEADDPLISAIEAIILERENLIAAQYARYNPPLTTDQKRSIKIGQLKDEGLTRIQSVLAGISSFDELELISEQWLSMSPAARNPTTKFQQVIDIYTAGKNAVSEIKALILEGEIDAYNVITDPAWPI